MNNEDLRAYEDFQGHFSELDDHHMKIYANKAKKYLKQIQKEAKKYNVDPNYYVLEFL